MNFTREDLIPALSFKTSRSGGKGGQHVNKVSSKVELNFDIDAAAVFSAAQKQKLKEKLAGKLTANGLLQIISQEDRSQYANKGHSIDKLFYLLLKALHEPKKRKASKPGRSAIENRLKQKQQQALKKLNRRKGFGE